MGMSCCVECVDYAYQYNMYDVLCMYVMYVYLVHVSIESATYAYNVQYIHEFTCTT